MGQLSNILSILTAKEKKSLSTYIVFNIIISLLDIAFLAAALFLISYYTTNGIPVKSWLFPKIFFENHPLGLSAAFLALFGAKNLLAFKLSSSQNGFSYRVAARISKRNLDNYFESEYLDFVAIDSSVRIRKISQQPIELCHYVLNSLQDIIIQAALILFAVTAMLIYNAQLFFLLFLLLLPPVILTGFLVKKKAKALRMEVKDAGEKSIQYLQESLSAYIESNLYHKKDFFSDRYARYQQQLNGFLARQQSIQGLPSRLIEVFAILGFFLLVLISRHYQPGLLSVATIGIFMASAYKIIPGIVRILNNMGQMKAYEFTVTDIIAEKEMADSPVSEPVLLPVKSVAFDHVDFSYKGKKIFEDFSLEISSGDFIGISGLSGAGKTTIINLLLGFLEPDKGSIDINHLPETTEMRRSYRKKIAYVKQQPFMLHDSIEKNISLSDEICCPNKLHRALQVSGLDNLLSQFPSGINEIIRENGKNISGGQRQRIAIARAVYKSADLIILDEAFSELDARSEKEITAHFKALADEGKIVILISHSAGGLSSCNRSIVL